MGQVALGLKNLAVRIAIFVVMAALLAWVLGGTLFPAAHRVNLAPWSFDGATWNWRVSGSGTVAGPVTWTLWERRGRTLREERFGIDGTWRQVWGPLMEDGRMTLGLATAAANGTTSWWRVRLDSTPGHHPDIRSFDRESEFLREVNGARGLDAGADAGAGAGADAGAGAGAGEHGAPATGESRRAP